MKTTTTQPKENTMNEKDTAHANREATDTLLGQLTNGREFTLPELWGELAAAEHRLDAAWAHEIERAWDGAKDTPEIVLKAMAVKGTDRERELCQRLRGMLRASEAELELRAVAAQEARALLAESSSTLAQAARVVQQIQLRAAPGANGSGRMKSPTGPGWGIGEQRPEQHADRPGERERELAGVGAGR